MAKFNASVSVDGNGVLTLKLGKVFSEFQRGDDPNDILFVTFYETIAGKKFRFSDLDTGGSWTPLEQKNETTFTCTLPSNYFVTMAGRQLAVEVEVETDGPGDYEAWTTVNTPASLAPAEPLPEITSITYDPVTRTISAMLSNGQIAEPDQLNFAFIAHYGSNQATVENGSWEYTPEVIGEIIDASIAECNEKNRKYVGTSFCFRFSQNGGYGPGRAIYIYPDGSWKDLGTATSAPVAPGKDTTPPEKVTGLAVPVVDGKYKATLSWDTGVDNSGKVANYEIQLDNGKILKSSKTTLNVSNLSVGEHSYRVRAIDKDRNVGEWSEAKTFTVKDMTAPNSVKAKATVNGYSVTFALSGKDNSGSVARYVVTCGDKSVETTTGTAVLSDFGVGRQTAYVVAYDAEGNASKETKVSFTVKDATPPEQVTGLAVPVVDSKYKATLSWDTGVDNSGKVANYEIQLDNGKILKSSKNSLSVSKLAVGEHTYRVRAVDKEKNVGEWSEVQTFTVKDMTAPTSVKGKATVDGYIVTFALSGKDNSGSIAKYVVTCGDQSVETTTETAVLSDFGVGKQTAYVVAYDAEGNASKETKVSFTVKDATPPEKVTGLVEPEVDAKYKAVLSWDPGVDNSGKVANYEIQLDDGKILKSSKTTLNVSNLSVGEHSYKVRAIDKDKNVGEWSEVQTFVVEDMTAPGSVSAKAKVEGNSLFLSWKTPKDNVGVTGYLLQYGEELENSAYLAADVLEYRIDGIARGSYQYRLTAFDAAGNESKPKIGKATIKTDLPVAELNGESPVAMELCCFEPATSALPADDPLAFCNTLRLDAELSLSASELVGSLENERRSESLFATAS